jgi:hypothetical protein
LSSHLLFKNFNINIYKTIILLIVLYGHETCSVTLRVEHTSRVFGNRVLRRMFGPKREEVAGNWTRLHKKKPHNLYASSNIIWMIKSKRMR